MSTRRSHTSLHVLGLCVSCLFLSVVTKQSKACQICDDTASILVDKVIDPALPDTFSFVKTCGQAASLAESILKPNSDECIALQAVATYCGCPIPENACYLCSHAYNETSETTSFDLRVQNETKEIDFHGLPLVKSTCAFVEAYLHSVDPNSETCQQGQAFARECGCQAEDGDKEKNQNETGTDTSGNKSHDSKAAPSCYLCADDRPLAFPEKDLTIFLETVNLDSLSFIFTGRHASDITVTCNTLNLVLQGIQQDTSTCTDARYYLAGICGCPPPQFDQENKRQCRFCGNTELDWDRTVYMTQEYGFPPLSCRDIVLFTQQIEQEDEMCFYARSVRHLCGCHGGEFNYLNTGTSSKRRSRKYALAWVPRVTALFSLLGSSYIIWDILVQRRRNSRRTMTVYHELICAISIFDVIGSLAWIFSSLPVPVYNEYGDPTGVWGARGNEATCTAQGFFLQLGYTSIFYNVALSFYYLLTIRYSWREGQTRQYGKWFHIPTIGLGLALALAGIPFYQNSFFVCYLVPPPLAENRRVIVFLAIVPIATSIVLATINMCLVYGKVRAQDARANRWRFNARAEEEAIPSDPGPSNDMADADFAVASTTNTAPPPPTRSRKLWQDSETRRSPPSTRQRTPNKLERAVFWQSFFYLGAFYFTWPLLMVAFLEKDKAQRSFAYWLSMVAISPLQGFLNCIVYTRLRLSRKLQEMQHRRMSITTSSTLLGQSTEPWSLRSAWLRFFSRRTQQGAKDDVSAPDCEVPESARSHPPEPERCETALASNKRREPVVAI